MKSKSFLFINSWMQPLKALSFEQRWNVLEAVVEYACSETLSESLDAIEGIAFGFIRNEIDRMKSKHAEVSAKKRAAANSRWERKQTESLPRDSSPCNDMHPDAPYDIESESKSGSESKPESSDKPTATTDARVRGNAGKASSSYDDSQLLGRFFDCQNQAKLDALGMKHHVGISDLRRLAEEITMQWALTDKTHDSYHDAATHLVYALGDRIARDRKSLRKAIAEGTVPIANAKGMLGVGEYYDDKGLRTYNGIDIIPNDAPPRPGKAFYWNHATDSWDDIQ